MKTPTALPAHSALSGWLLVSSALVCFAGGGLGCGGSQRGADIPNATLAVSNDAQLAFRPLLKRWVRSSLEERRRLEPELFAFTRAYPKDPIERIAVALLAWIALEREDLDRADLLARRVIAGDAGTTQNIARVVEGAVLRRRGDATGALTELSPLVSKLVDPWARTLLNHEVVAAALTAKRYDDAIRFMEVALREAADEDRQTERAAVAKLLPGMPEENLLALLERRRAGSEAEELEVPALTAHHLADRAVERQDMGLAKRLLATAGPLLGDQGDAIAKLAQGGGAARVDARTVGLLLSTRDEESRRRGAEVATGLAAGLGLPGSPARLVTRDDGGGTGGAREALNELGAEGAAIIVAGVNVAQSKLAAEFAEAKGIPVILLRPPELGAPAGARFVFVLGEDPARTLETLEAAFVGRGVTSIASIGEPDEIDNNAHTTIPSSSPTLACGSALPLAAWKGAGVGGIALNGGLDCVADSLAALTHGPLRSILGVGLEGGAVKLSAPGFVAQAGQYPINAGTTVSSVRAWIGSHGSTPSWWSGLGRDAGLLAWEGVRALPQQGTEDPKEVAARRAAAAQALARASGELWTTEARGFEGGRVLARRISVRDR